jgi:hypothetical protein
MKVVDPYTLTVVITNQIQSRVKSTVSVVNEGSLRLFVNSIPTNVGITIMSATGKVRVNPKVNS